VQQRRATPSASLNKLVVLEEDFDYSYDEIFSDVMEKARELADSRPLGETQAQGRAAVGQ
jgi:hypothetical protein